ncbi:hypothetical protein PCE1_003223 [Barthelona sp. PCE]
MPIVSPKITENFILTLHNDKFIVSSIDEKCNTLPLRFIEKNESTVIYGPDSSLHGEFSSYEMLKPTLLEPTVFSRVARNYLTETRVELFEFNDGQFSSIGVHVFPYYFRGFLLNRRYLVREKFKHHNISLDFLVLEGDTCTLEYSYTFASSLTYAPLKWWTYLVQYGNVYMVCCHEFHYRIIGKITISDEGVPTVFEEFPLRQMHIFTLDRTPGDNCFIFESNGELCTSNSDDYEFQLIPIDFDLPFNNTFDHIEYAYVLNTFVHSNEDKPFPMCKCELWDFILLEPTQLSRNAESLEKHPVILDLYANTIALTHVSSDQNDESFFCYSNNDEVARIEKPTNARKLTNISFNRHHCIASFAVEGGSEFFVNGTLTGGDFDLLRYPSLVGHNVWLLENNYKIVLLLLSTEESSVVSKFYNHYERIKQLTCNSYCQNECFIRGTSEAQIILFDTDTQTFKTFSVEFCGKSFPLFIDQGIVLYGERAYVFNSSGIQRVFDVSFFRKSLQSPRRGVAVHYSRLNNMKLSVGILTYDDCECDFRVESKTVEIYDFLSSCNVTCVFSFFDHYSS